MQKKCKFSVIALILLAARVLPRWRSCYAMFPAICLRKTLLILAILPSFTPVCPAQDPQIQPIPSDQKELVVSGRPGSDSTLIGRITLLSSKAVPELLFRPSDLQRQSGSETVPRVQIQPVVSGKLSLPENTPQDFDFKVAGLKLPGTYTGSVDFLLPQHGISAAIHLSLKVQVEETPKLSLRKDSQNVKIQIVNCSLPGCWVTRWFLPNALIEDHSFTLDNSSALPFRITGAGASATGDVNRQNTGDALILQTPPEIPPEPIIDFPFRIKNRDLAPDHYVGDIQLRLPGNDQPLKVPLEINVSDGPLLPIIVLFFGILFGRLVKYMKDKGTPQSDLLLQLSRLVARAKQNPDDEQRLLHLIDQTRQDIEQMQLEQAKAEIQTINIRLNLLARLRFLETLLTGSNDPGVPTILRDIATARNQISLEVDPTALATQIETEVQNLAAPGNAPVAAAGQQLLAAASSVRSAAAALAPIPPPPPVPRFSRFLRSSLVLLTGHTDDARAAFTLWVLRPLLYLILLLLLVFVGLTQLYFKNPIFGANLVSDYFGLFVWASSSDVASRTLSSFKGS